MEVFTEIDCADCDGEGCGEVDTTDARLEHVTVVVPCELCDGEGTVFERVESAA